MITASRSRNIGIEEDEINYMADDDDDGISVEPNFLSRVPDDE
jgi:hypothetical protein